MDPTRSTSRHDSLLKRKKMKKVYEFWENSSPRRTVLFGVATYFYFYLLWGKSSKNKTPNDYSQEETVYET